MASARDSFLCRRPDTNSFFQDCVLLCCPKAVWTFFMVLWRHPPTRGRFSFFLRCSPLAFLPPPGRNFSRPEIVSRFFLAPASFLSSRFLALEGSHPRTNFFFPGRRLRCSSLSPRLLFLASPLPRSQANSSPGLSVFCTDLACFFFSGFFNVTIRKLRNQLSQVVTFFPDLPPPKEGNFLETSVLLMYFVFLFRIHAVPRWDFFLFFFFFCLSSFHLFSFPLSWLFVVSLPFEPTPVNPPHPK